MPTFKENLTALLAAETDEVTPERLTALSKAAEALTAANAAPPKPKLAAVPDPIAAARARYAELQRQPLPAGASETTRVERARENAALLKTITGRADEDVNANGGTFIFRRPEPPGAA